VHAEAAQPAIPAMTSIGVACSGRTR
jgi:hypothetical protein